MKKLSLLILALMLMGYGSVLGFTLSKVSPSQGGVPGDRIIVRNPVTTNVVIKADAAAGTMIAATSSNPGAVSVTPGTMATGADSTAAFALSASSNAGDTATVKFSATGATDLLVYAREAQFIKVSPPEGSSPGNPILVKYGPSETVVKVKVENAGGADISVSSSKPTNISAVGPTVTGSDSTASFTVIFNTPMPPDTVTLTFSSTGFPPLPVYVSRSAPRVPSLTTYGLIVLALLLAGTAVWMFRRRRVSVAA